MDRGNLRRCRRRKQTAKQLGLTDISGTLLPNISRTRSLNCEENITKVDHILGYKTSLNKFLNIQVIQVCSLATMDLLEINNRRTPGKPPNIWKLNNIYIQISQVKEVLKRNIKKYFEINEN